MPSQNGSFTVKGFGCRFSQSADTHRPNEPNICNPNLENRIALQHTYCETNPDSFPMESASLDRSFVRGPWPHRLSLRNEPRITRSGPHHSSTPLLNHSAASSRPQPQAAKPRRERSYGAPRSLQSQSPRRLLPPATSEEFEPSPRHGVFR